MARHNISKADIKNLLEVRYATVLDKLNGKSRFFFDEALIIKKKFFPDISIEYLFESDETSVVSKKGA